MILYKHQRGGNTLDSLRKSMKSSRPQLKPTKPYIKKVLGNSGPTNLFYVNSRGNASGITQSNLDTKYAHLKNTMKTVNYKR
jgi:hypothetical protein